TRRPATTRPRRNSSRNWAGWIGRSSMRSTSIRCGCGRPGSGTMPPAASRRSAIPASKPNSASSGLGGGVALPALGEARLAVGGEGDRHQLRTVVLEPVTARAPVGHHLGVDVEGGEAGAEEPGAGRDGGLDDAPGLVAIGVGAGAQFLLRGLAGNEAV